MFCSRCGSRNDDDAKYCDRCGADLSTMPKPSVAGGTPAAAPSPPPAVAPPYGPPYAPPTTYPPGYRHAWWYPIGVWVILAAFFSFIDLTTTHTITWSIWPVGILGIFMVGIPLLNLVEQRAARPR